MTLLLGLLACNGVSDDPPADSPSDPSHSSHTGLVSTGSSAATAETGSSGTTGDTSTTSPPEGWVLQTFSDFADVEGVTVSVGSNPAGPTMVLDVYRGGRHELWFHNGSFAQLLDNDDAIDFFVPSIRGREGFTHVMSRARCDRHSTTCPDPEVMKLVEMELPDGWDGVTPWVERPVSGTAPLEDGVSQLVPQDDLLHLCHTVYELGDEVECHTRPTSGGDWSEGQRITDGSPGPDDHPNVLVTSRDEFVIGHTTVQGGSRGVRLLLGGGASVELGVDLTDGETRLTSDWMTLAETDDGDLAAMWGMEPASDYRLALGRCGAPTLAGCADVDAWERSWIDPAAAGSQKNPNLAGAPGALLASWQHTESRGSDKRVRFVTVCDDGTRIPLDPDPEGNQSTAYSAPGMVYEPSTNTVYLGYVRDRGAGLEVVLASLHDPAGACP